MHELSPGVRHGTRTNCSLQALNFGNLLHTLSFSSLQALDINDEHSRLLSIRFIKNLNLQSGKERCKNINEKLEVQGKKRKKIESKAKIRSVRHGLQLDPVINSAFAHRVHARPLGLGVRGCVSAQLPDELE
jgi:hypothetical protein